VLLGIVIVFQLPLVVLGLVALGVLSSGTLRKHRRVGYFVVTVIALALPGPDPMTTFLEMSLALPCGSDILGVGWK
jgi:Sec-independent protein secretion pathway component TatC